MQLPRCKRNKQQFLKHGDELIAGEGSSCRKPKKITTVEEQVLSLPHTIRMRQVIYPIVLPHHKSGRTSV